MTPMIFTIPGRFRMPSEPFSTLNPWKITVKLQRTTSDDAEATGALWEDVYKSDGTLYTADISSTHLTEADYTF